MNLEILYKSCHPVSHNRWLWEAHKEDRSATALSQLAILDVEYMAIAPSNH